MKKMATVFLIFLLKISFTWAQNTNFAVPDTILVQENTLTILDVTSNDQNTLNLSTIHVTSPPKKGSSWIINGQINYHPYTDFVGKDSLDYQVCSVNGGCDTAKVYIHIIPSHITAQNDLIFINQNETKTFNVLDNDIDVDTVMQLASLTILSAPQYGNSSLNPNTNNITYTPNTDFFGQDQLTYQVCSVNGGCDTATVEINIQQEINFAIDDTIHINEDETVSINCLQNDIGDLNNYTLKIISSPQNGSSYLNNSTNGNITYIPNNNFFGKDEFIYEICHKNGLCDTAKVSISIAPVNDVMHATNDYVTTYKGTSKTFNIIANDHDYDNDISSLIFLSNPTYGNSVIDPTTKEVTYTPNSHFFGEDVFTYQICSTDGSCDTANVLIHVLKKLNFAYNDTITTKMNTSITTNVIHNDYTTNLDLSSLTIIYNPKNGTSSINTTTGEITYIPNQNFFGEDFLDYQICKINGECDTAKVLIHVTPDVIQTTTTEITNHNIVYPNPSTGIFNIHCKEDAMITIYNAIGKMIITTSAKTINLGNQPNGVYFYQIQNETGIKTGQLIKQ